MHGVDAGRTVVVIDVVAGKRRTHASSFHLALGVDTRAQAHPAGLGDGAVSGRADPAFVDRMGEHVDEDGGGRGFQVGVVTVEHLVPQAGTGLGFGDAVQAGAQLREYLVVRRMVFWQHVEQVAHGQHGPAVGARPVKARRVRVVGVPAVGKQAVLLVVQVLGHGQNVRGGIVEPGFVAGQVAHLGQRGNAHVHVIGPQRRRLRTLAREGAVGQPVLLLLHVAAAGVDHVLEVGTDLGKARAHQRCAHRAAVVERHRLQETGEAVGAAQLELVFLGAEIRLAVLEELEMAARHVGIALVAGHFGRLDQAGMNHAHLVDHQTKIVGRRLEHGAGDRFFQVGDRLTGSLVDDAGGGDAVHVAAYTVQRAGDVGGGGLFVRNRVRAFARIVEVFVIRVAERSARLDVERRGGMDGPRGQDGGQQHCEAA